MFPKKSKPKLNMSGDPKLMHIPIAIKIKDPQMIKILESADGKMLFEHYDSFRKTVIELIVDYWRLAKLISKLEVSLVPSNLREELARFEDTLKKNKFAIRDMTNKPYSEGLALDVIHFEKVSDPNLTHAIVSETIRPTIYFNDQVIERGEVIVTEPMKKEV